PCCGDGIKNGAEECDTNDMGGETCVSRGWDAGNLYCWMGACSIQEGFCCRRDASSCNLCGTCDCGTMIVKDNCGTVCTDDCGACPFTCGANGCEACETCESCPGDCGPCCGNKACDFGETAGTCPGDCPPYCPDGFCNGTEDCTWCYGDCGGCCRTGSGGSCDFDADCCTNTCVGGPGGVCF